MNAIRPTFGYEIGNLSLRPPTSSWLPELVKRHQFVVLRKQDLTLEQQVDLTSALGTPEQCWEDRHPENEMVQLMDSKVQKTCAGQGSSQYWHLDRSFMAVPTRFTVLYAKYADASSRGTQILDGRLLYTRVENAVDTALVDLSAVHAFAYRFPDIMKAKGRSEVEIVRKMSAYPDVVHPLVRVGDLGNALYYSDLCVKEIHNVSSERSRSIIEAIKSFLNAQDMVYEHRWRKGDVLIWDNFSTIHRAGRSITNMERVLHRTTAVAP